MIITPHPFGQKLIIAALAAVATTAGIFGYSAYESHKTQELFLTQEKKLVEHELSQIISSYEDLKYSHSALAVQFDSLQRSSQMAMDKLKLTDHNLDFFVQLKSELATVKAINSKLNKSLDSARTYTVNLESDKRVAQNALQEQQASNEALIKTNNFLNHTLKKTALLTINALYARAHKTNGHDSQTTRAGQTKHIDICFSIPKNELVPKGAKDIYIQVVNPLNNVIGNKGALKFGDSSLIYSYKHHINYAHEALNICSNIEVKRYDKPLVKGVYHVSVFHDDHKLGNTQFVLN